MVAAFKATNKILQQF